MPAVRALCWTHPSSATGLGCFHVLGTGISPIPVLPQLLQRGSALGWCLLQLRDGRGDANAGYDGLRLTSPVMHFSFSSLLA